MLLSVLAFEKIQRAARMDDDVEFTMIMRILFIVLGVVAVLVTVAVIWIRPRNLWGYWKYGGQARKGSLSVGDPAPDVPLAELDGSTLRSMHHYIGDQPLVVVFGSFT